MDKALSGRLASASPNSGEQQELCRPRSVLGPTPTPESKIRNLVGKPRAHRFFSTARWQVDQIGLTVLDLVVTHLVDPPAECLLLAVDDTAHRRRGEEGPWGRVDPGIPEEITWFPALITEYDTDQHSPGATEPTHPPQLTGPT